MSEAAAIQSTHGVSVPLWRRLIVATSIGWILGIVAGVLLIIVVESLGLRGLQSPLVFGVALGLSTQQQRALRDFLAGSRARWIIATCIGLAAPFVIADVASTIDRPVPYDLVVYVILGGVFASVLQWDVLRRLVLNANLWLLASPLAYAAASSVMWLNDRVLPRIPGITGALLYIAVILAGGVLFGCITAVAAVRFVSRTAVAAEA